MRHPARYSFIQIALHWGVVLLLIVQFLSADAMGGYFRALMRAAEGRPAMGAAVWHIVGGALVLAFMLVRLAVRSTHGVPQPKADSPGWDPVLSRLNHWLLYAALIVMPVLGLTAYLGKNREAAELHEMGATVVLVLVGLHVLGALYHQFFLKDGLILRMVNAEHGVERVPPVDPRR